MAFDGSATFESAPNSDYKSYTDLKQVRMDFKHQNIINTPFYVPATYYRRRNSKSAVRPELVHTTGWTDTGRTDTSTSRNVLNEDAGYLYPVDDSRSTVTNHEMYEFGEDQPNPETKFTCSGIKEEVVENEPAGMKVCHQDGEVYVELYGHHYPIDVSTKIDIANTVHRKDNKHTLYACVTSSQSHEESAVLSNTMCCGPTQRKRSRSKDTQKFKCRQKRMQRGCRLWEFIRDLLHNPQYNPSHIKWVDRSAGEFRLIKSNQIARMWGAKKNNECMTYEKLSRAMRYYYKREILSPVLGKRLVYRFGAKSYGW